MDVAAPYVDAQVTVRVAAAAAQDDSLIRLFLGIIFAVVWTLIMSVPLILWLRRRRARAGMRKTPHRTEKLLPKTDLLCPKTDLITTAPARACAGEIRAAQIMVGRGAPATVGAARRGARGHGVRTKPRRFKALKVSDWVADRGISRRRHGWVLADAQVT